MVYESCILSLGALLGTTEGDMMSVKSGQVWFVGALLAAGCSPDGGASGENTDPFIVPDTSEMGDEGPRKVENPTFEDNGVPNSSSNDDSSVCEAVQVVAEREVANVMVMLDRSGSMYSPGGFFASEVDKWTPAINAVKGAINARSQSIAFGLMKFGTGEGCDPGQVNVMPEIGVMGAVTASLEGTPSEVTGGMTPTAESLAAAGEAISTLEGEKYILLVTDGAPNCNDEAGLGGECKCPGGFCDYWEECLDDNRTVRTIEELAVNDVKTFVIGYDTGGLTDVLNRMAVAGNTGTSQYIAVSDQQTLSDALASLTSQVASCSYELESVPSDIRYVSVQLGGGQIDHESVSTNGGWRLDGNTVEILGGDCEHLQAQDRAKIDITVECELVLR